MLDLAARHALRAQGDVEPGAIVGCVIEMNGQVVAIGHHRRHGGPHAEREALDSCARRGIDPRGATMYVTLEPCNAHGKNPPCSEAVINAGIAKVVYACDDPNPLKAGGAARLREAGIDVELCNESSLACDVSEPFRHRLLNRRPWVIAKWAQTIDGRIATRTGESKWISSPRSRARVHRLRARVDAIITGIGTVLADDPALNARDVPRARRIARRVVCDTDLDIPLDCQLVRTARDIPTTIACAAELVGSEIMRDKQAKLEAAGIELLAVPAGQRGVDLEALMRLLMERHICATVLVEAGPGLLGSLFDADLVDEAVVYIAPMLLGDEMARSVAVGRVAQSLSAARRLRLCRSKPIGDDIELTYRRRR